MRTRGRANTWTCEHVDMLPRGYAATWTCEHVDMLPRGHARHAADHLAHLDALHDHTSALVGLGLGTDVAAVFRATHRGDHGPGGGRLVRQDVPIRDDEVLACAVEWGGAAVSRVGSGWDGSEIYLLLSEWGGAAVSGVGWE